MFNSSEQHKVVKLYEDENSSLPIRTIEVLICKKCGKIKKITIWRRFLKNYSVRTTMKWFSWKRKPQLSNVQSVERLEQLKCKQYVTDTLK